MVLEEQGKRLVIDTGDFAKSLNDYQNVVGVVITHNHGDHFDKELVGKIVSANPQAMIFSVKEVTDQLSNSNKTTVNSGDAKVIGPFSLSFYGKRHEFVHNKTPDIQNLGVLVNEVLYYPGDSFSQPDQKVKVLAVPSGAPWMKVGEAMDFLSAIKPDLAFPTHNAVLSEAGNQFANNWLAQAGGAGFRQLEIGQSLEV